jgi:hypothetical protein
MLASGDFAMPQTANSNRRRDRRAKPRPSVKAICRIGALDLGENIGMAVLDLSETGIRLIVSRALHANQEVCITLTSATNIRPVQCPATVAWCVEATRQTWVAGVHFDKRMPYIEWQRLT